MINTKKSFLALTCFVLMFPAILVAQGIHFEHESWNAIKAKAQKENKSIFVDVYTDWCAPCRKMSKEVFPTKEVGDFFNENFVSYKLDAEKGEGIGLAKQYAVASFPTLLFLDANGNLLHRSSGYATSAELIQLAKEAQDPQNRFGVIEAEFLSGNRDKAFMLDYFQALRKAGGSVDPKLGIYLSGLSKNELLTKENYDLMMRYGYNVKGKEFELLLDNFQAFCELGSKREVVDKISKRYLLSHSHHVGANFAEKYVDTTVITYLRTTNYPYKTMLEDRMEINFLCNCRKMDQATTKALTFLEAYAKTNPELITPTLKNLYRQVSKPEDVAALLQWSEQALASGNHGMEAYTMNASLNGKAKKYELAIQSAEKVRDMAKEENNPSMKIEALILLANLYAENQNGEKALQLAKEAQDLCIRAGENNYKYKIKRIEALIQKLM